jgi:hypothetical protein
MRTYADKQKEDKKPQEVAMHMGQVVPVRSKQPYGTSLVAPRQGATARAHGQAPRNLPNPAHFRSFKKYAPPAVLVPTPTPEPTVEVPQ